MYAIAHHHHHATHGAAGHDTHAAHDAAHPGKSTLDHDAEHDEASVVGDAEWEEIEPHELLAQPPAPSPEDHEADEEQVAALRADAPAPQDPAATPAPAPTPTGPVAGYANEHRKVIRDYVVGKRRLKVTDLKGRSRGRVNERANATQFADDKISVDIGTVIGSARGGYKTAYVLVWQERAGRDKDRRRGPDGKLLNPDNKSADPTGWIKVGKLPKAAQRDIKKLQDRLRKQRRKSGATGPGFPARPIGVTLTVAPRNPTSITEKWVTTGSKVLEAFRIAGGGIDPDTGDPKSTPCGNYTLNPRYGDNIVGVWNPPGSSGSGGARNGGSGGIRVFVPLGTPLQLCDVTPITIGNVDTGVGSGTSTWVYVTARINREQIYFWILQSWTFTTTDGGDRSGANV